MGTGNPETESQQQGNGFINVGSDGVYSGQIKRKLPFTWTNTCVWCDDEDGSKTESKEITYESMPLDIPLTGRVSDALIEGTKQLPGFTYTTIWVNWDFAARPW